VPPLNPTVADSAPDEPALTSYDEQHAVTYARLLDAEADNADWHEVARIVLRVDPASEPERARNVYESHLARAKWVARHGYRHLLNRGWSKSE
jgi:type VI secretion system activator RovC-like protein